jgi:hypothetical protein
MNCDSVEFGLSDEEGIKGLDRQGRTGQVTGDGGWLEVGWMAQYNIGSYYYSDDYYDYYDYYYYY